MTAREKLIKNDPSYVRHFKHLKKRSTSLGHTVYIYGRFTSNEYKIHLVDKHRRPIRHSKLENERERERERQGGMAERREGEGESQRERERERERSSLFTP